MERKELLKSQQGFLQVKLAQAQLAQQEAQSAINTVASELGINPEEQWTLAPDCSYFEKPEKK